MVSRIIDHEYAEVITERRDACSDCGASHCCSSFGAHSKMVTKALNRSGAKKGDRVSIRLRSFDVTKSAAIAYLIPVAGFMTGVLTGAGIHVRLGLSETASVMLFGFAGLGLGILSTVWISRWVGSKKGLTPVITRVLSKAMASPSSQLALDPVCHIAVDPATAPAAMVFRNKTYFFCHPNCQRRFMKEPDRFL